MEEYTSGPSLHVGQRDLQSMKHAPSSTLGRAYALATWGRGACALLTRGGGTYTLGVYALPTRGGVTLGARVLPTRGEGTLRARALPTRGEGTLGARAQPD